MPASLVLVEGESDAQTLWMHDIPALGLPGAASWQEPWADELKEIREILVVQGWALARRPWLVESGAVIVVDVYDPLHLEQLERTRSDDAVHRREVVWHANAVLNEQLGRSAGTQQLTRVAGDWRLHFAPARPLAALEAVARSAARTLADVGTAVRRCAGETCSLFFTDNSPTGSRRWCDATTCGVNGRVERRRGNRR